MDRFSLAGSRFFTCLGLALLIVAALASPVQFALADDPGNPGGSTGGSGNGPDDCKDVHCAPSPNECDASSQTACLGLCCHGAGNFCTCSWDGISTCSCPS
jgi:hypothetical protein